MEQVQNSNYLLLDNSLHQSFENFRKLPCDANHTKLIERINSYQKFFYLQMSTKTDEPTTEEDTDDYKAPVRKYKVTRQNEQGTYSSDFILFSQAQSLADSLNAFHLKYAGKTGHPNYIVEQYYDS